MATLQDLPNIGRELEKNLAAVGITSSDALKKIGSQKAFLRIKEGGEV